MYTAPPYTPFMSWNITESSSRLQFPVILIPPPDVQGDENAALPKPETTTFDTFSVGVLACPSPLYENNEDTGSGELADILFPAPTIVIFAVEVRTKEYELELVSIVMSSCGRIIVHGPLAATVVHASHAVGRLHVESSTGDKQAAVSLVTESSADTIKVWEAGATVGVVAEHDTNADPNPILIALALVGYSYGDPRRENVVLVRNQ